MNNNSLIPLMASGEDSLSRMRLWVMLSGVHIFFSDIDDKLKVWLKSLKKKSLNRLHTVCDTQKKKLFYWYVNDLRRMFLKILGCMESMWLAYKRKFWLVRYLTKKWMDLDNGAVFFLCERVFNIGFYGFDQLIKMCIDHFKDWLGLYYFWSTLTAL